MNDKKVLIFDFDGTFYSGEKVFDKLPEYMINHRRDMLASITDEQYETIEKENPTWQDACHGSDIVNHIYMFKQKYPEFNITINDYIIWENLRPDPIDIDENEVVNPKFLEKICKEYKTYVVSNSSPTHLHFYMKKLGINPKWFEEIISNNFIEEDRTKKHYYQDILNMENCLPKNTYVFGDSEKSDLLPARELGINTHLITDARKLEDVVNKAIGRNFEKDNMGMCAD